MSSDDPDEEISWKGSIRFVQGVDPARGPYIECRDNGVGMRHDDLLNCFAKAGRRFTDSEEYLEEKTAWRKHELEHYPNSQFGIGVFSYFMLAEELEITTRRADRDGQPLQETLRATVSGSGSLFRVRPAEKHLADAGTTIRLYLNRTAHRDEKGNERRISALEILKDQLWVAQYPTRATEGDEEYVWRPGVLKTPHFTPNSVIIPIINNIIWWKSELHQHESKGLLLVDGIKTETKEPHLIVNLFGEHTPRLTADRKKVLNRPADWIEQALAKDGWKVFKDHSFDLLENYWLAAKIYPLVMQRAFDQGMMDCKTIGGDWPKLNGCLLKAGIFISDGHLFEGVFQRLRLHPIGTLRHFITATRSWPEKLLFSRIIIWRDIGITAHRHFCRWLERRVSVHNVIQPLGPQHALGLCPLCNNRGDSHWPIPPRVLSPPAIVWSSFTFQCTPSEALQRIEVLRQLDVAFPDYNAAELSLIPVFDKTDAELLEFFRSEEISIMRAFSVFKEKNIKPDDMVTKLNNLRFIGIRIPNIPAEIWRSGLPLDAIDTYLLDGEDNFPITSVAPWKIIVTCVRSTAEIDTVLARIETYVSLGIVVNATPKKDIPSQIDHLDRKLIKLSPFPFVKDHRKIRMLDIVTAAIKSSKEDKRLLAEKTTAYHGYGFDIPPIEMTDILGFDDRDHHLYNVRHYRINSPSGLSMDEIFSAQKYFKFEIDDLSQRLARYRRCGATIPNINIAPLLANSDLDAVHKMLGNSPDGALSPAAIVVAAVGRSLDVLRRRIDWCRDNGVTVPTVDFAALDRLPAMDMQDADIIGALDDKEGRSELTFDDLDAVAIIFRIKRDDFAVRLEKWRAAGFTVPDITEFDEADTFNPENYG